MLLPEDNENVANEYNIVDNSDDISDKIEGFEKFRK